MKDDNEIIENHEEWKRISSALFNSSTPDPSDFFVTRVMARIRAESEKMPGWRSFLIKWGLPVAGLGVAAWLFLMTLPPFTNGVTLEDLLYLNGTTSQDMLVENVLNF